MHTGYSNYQVTQASTADSGELLLMLFDGAIRFTHKAIAGIEAGDVLAKCESISRAFAIVAELHGTLDFDVSEEITGNLASLYLFVLESYAKANIEGDDEYLRGVLTVLETLREGWVGAVLEVRQSRGEQVMPLEDPRANLSVLVG